MNKALQKVSHVIELKKDKKYIFVFEKGEMNKEIAFETLKTLKKHGFEGIGLLIKDAGNLKVFEKEV